LLIQNHCKDLCALAFSGQLSRSEIEELENHLSLCPECRSEVGDFARIVAQMPDVASKRNPVVLPSGLTDRFLARARSEGIPLSRMTEKEERRRALPGVTFGVAGFVAAAVIITVGLVLLREFQSYGAMRSHSRATVFNAGQAQPGTGARKAAEYPNEELIRQNTRLKEQVQRMGGDLAALEAKLNSDKERVSAAEAAKATLQASLTSAETTDAGLRHDVSVRDAQLAYINGEFEKLRELKDTDALAFKVEESELNNLREQVANLNVKLRNSEQLSAAANQAKELIVARHLHIVDVDDTDENGNRQRPFGRIFYTEGKRIIFYAYDLSDPRRLDAKINFYVWGSREGIKQPVKSLGIFHSDDATTGRWVLQFEDPDVLAQINCIFVTAESSKKAVTQPTGKQLLFASLGKTINHP